MSPFILTVLLIVVEIVDKSSEHPILSLSETQPHKLATCERILPVWNFLREKIEVLEPQLVFESDYNILHLNYPKLVHENTILWLLGQYVDFIEEEVLLKNNNVIVAQFIGRITSNKLCSAYMALPEIGFIPGLHPTGVG